MTDPLRSTFPGVMKQLTKKQRNVLEMFTQGADDIDVCRSLGIQEDELAGVLEEISQAVASRPTHYAMVARYERGMRMRQQRKATAISARFNALLDASPLAVFVVDGVTGIIKQTNEYASQVLGYEHPALVGTSVEDLVAPSFRSKHVAFRLGFLASVRRREMGYHPPIYAVKADGSEVALSIALTATAFDDEVLVVCSDFVGTLKASSNANEQKTVS